MRYHYPLLVLSVTGCGVDEADFRIDFPAELCAYVITCEEDDEGTNEVVCEDALTATVDALSGDDTCTYSASQAQECLDTIAEASCDQSSSVSDACGPVYSGSTCNLTLNDYL